MTPTTIAPLPTGLRNSARAGFVTRRLSHHISPPSPTPSASTTIHSGTPATVMGMRNRTCSMKHPRPRGLARGTACPCCGYPTPGGSGSHQRLPDRSVREMLVLFPREIRAGGVAVKVAYCPYCQNVNPLDDRDWGLMVQCEGPRCERFFPTGPLAAAPSDVAPTPAIPPAAPFRFGPPPPPPVPPPPPAPPRLTAPHRCQVCYHESEPRALGEMNQPFARRRCTVLHRNPHRADNCRTDIYAALYHC